ncbi:MAG: hypothetical protein A4E63_01094 [Syntrophorhabdus sp. PtaU1.Bin050]|nr:MAG: hypothetical protein A4E63_01094 [Syntrophorhabdus sp. PtaU1.Bin050]
MIAHSADDEIAENANRGMSSTRVSPKKRRSKAQLAVDLFEPSVR